jgi:hypothetical protein
MIEHHFIIKYSKAEGWEWDTDSEELRYSDGTVWNEQAQEWSNGYIGWNKEKDEGEYLDDDDLIGEQLGAILDIANSENKVI